MTIPTNSWSHYVQFTSRRVRRANASWNDPTPHTEESYICYNVIMFHCGLRMGTFCSSFILYSSITEADIRQSVSRQLHASFLNITWARYNKFHSWEGWMNMIPTEDINSISSSDISDMRVCPWTPDRVSKHLRMHRRRPWIRRVVYAYSPGGTTHGQADLFFQSPMSIHDDTLSWFKTCETNIENMSGTNVFRDLYGSNCLSLLGPGKWPWCFCTSCRRAKVAGRFADLRAAATIQLQTKQIYLIMLYIIIWYNII